MGAGLLPRAADNILLYHLKPPVGREVVILADGKKQPLAEVQCDPQDDEPYRLYVQMMTRQWDQSPASWQVAEIGVGVNGGAQVSGIIMEDEAVRGTCHVCFGDNARYGGQNATDWHGGTVVFWHPHLEVIREP